MTDIDETSLAPRRVVVAGYPLARRSGWATYASRPDGTGTEWSVPESSILGDEPAPADQDTRTGPTDNDWAVIREILLLRYGPSDADLLVRQFQLCAEALRGGR